MRKRVLVLACVLAAAACAISLRAHGRQGHELQTSEYPSAELQPERPISERPPASAGEDTSNDRRYWPPLGFHGQLWNEPLSTFSRFEPEPLYVQTAFSRGKTTLVNMQCVSTERAVCDLGASLRSVHQKTEGKGFHTLAEYYVAAEGVEFTGTGALLFPVFYQFCARWGGFSGKVPEDIQSRMRFCGMRMLFRSETLEEIRAHPNTAHPDNGASDSDEVVTHYDRILRELIRMHGEPEDYSKRGLVIIATPDGRIVPPRERRFEDWRWCSLRGDRDIAPRCDASVVLAFDAKTGCGVVLYATRPVWEFAYARHHGGAPNDPLYKLLRGLHEYHPVDNACTGSHLCRPGPRRAMRQENRMRFRLRP